MIKYIFLKFKWLIKKLLVLYIPLRPVTHHKKYIIYNPTKNPVGQLWNKHSSWSQQLKKTFDIELLTHLLYTKGNNFKTIIR